jgi:hypothetical protein
LSDSVDVWARVDSGSENIRFGGAKERGQSVVAGEVLERGEQAGGLLEIDVGEGLAEFGLRGAIEEVEAVAVEVWAGLRGRADEEIEEVGGAAV